MLARSLGALGFAGVAVAILGCGARGPRVDVEGRTGRVHLGGDDAGAEAGVGLVAGLDTDRGAGAEAAEQGSGGAAEVPMEWGTSPTGAGPLYALADGMCVNAAVFPVEGGAIFTYGNGEYINWEYQNPTMITTAYVGETGITPEAGRGFGAALDGANAMLGMIGGAYPDHLFAVIDFPTRATFARQLRVGTLRPTGWRSVLGSSFGNELPPDHSGGFVAVSNPLRWSEGGYLFATSEQGLRTGMPDEPPPTYGARLLLADGTLAAKANLPGPDLAQIAFYSAAPRALARLASGEVVGIGYDERKKLVRWSPTRPVDDLPFPITPKAGAGFRGGKSRAVIALDDALYVYEGRGLAPASVNTKLKKGFTWTLGADDEIIVVQPDGVVIEEPVTGALREAKLPFPVTFEGIPAGLPWGVAPGRGSLGSDALVRKGPNGWEVVELPAPPFGSAAHTPLKVTSIKGRDATDVYVLAHRMESGFGWKRPASFRVLYGTKRPREAVRCQDAPYAWTGAGTHRWAPAADERCATPVVVASFGAGVAKGYPTAIAASLRGKKQFGETLTFVTFEGRGTTNLGILMPDFAKAKALASHLSTLEGRPEVSCGKPAVRRTFTLDVATGTFSN